VKAGEVQVHLASQSKVAILSKLRVVVSQTRKHRSSPTLANSGRLGCTRRSERERQGGGGESVTSNGSEKSVGVTRGDGSASQIRPIHSRDFVNLCSSSAEENAGAVLRQTHAADRRLQAEVRHVKSGARFEAMSPQSNSSILAAREDSVLRGIKNVHGALMSLHAADAIDVCPQEDQATQSTGQEAVRHFDR
jgi:hypothetical protein